MIMIAPWPRLAELRITRVFLCVARRFKACASFMFAGCCWWRSLAVDGGSGTSRGHGPVMRRPGSRRSGAVSRPSAHDARHLRALVLVTTLGLSTGPATAPCPAQTPPPNPTAAGPGDGRVQSRPSSRVHEPGTLTEAVALRSQTVLTGSGSHRSSYGGFGGGHPHFHPHAPDLLIRRFPCGHSDPFRSVRDLGCVPARCSCSSGFPEGCSPLWLPAWLPRRRVHGSGVRLSDLANLCTLPAWTRSLVIPVAKIIPRIFRIMETSAVAARTLQGMARVGSGQAPAWPLVLTGVSAVAPGSSATSRVRSPGTFHLCSLSCGHSYA